MLVARERPPVRERFAALFKCGRSKSACVACVGSVLWIVIKLIAGDPKLQDGFFGRRFGRDTGTAPHALVYQAVWVICSTQGVVIRS